MERLGLHEQQQRLHVRPQELQRVASVCRRTAPEWDALHPLDRPRSQCQRGPGHLRAFRQGRANGHLCQELHRQFVYRKSIYSHFDSELSNLTNIFCTFHAAISI